MISKIKLNYFSNEDAFYQYQGDTLSSMNSTYSEYRTYSDTRSSAVDRSTLNSTESSTMYSYVSSAGDLSSRKKRVTCHLCNQYLRKVDEKQCACGDFSPNGRGKSVPLLSGFRFLFHQLSL